MCNRKNNKVISLKSVIQLIQLQLDRSRGKTENIPAAGVKARPIYIQWALIKRHKQLFANKYKNLSTMDNFL